MSLRLGILSTAHVHTPSYAWCATQIPGVEVSGVWDDDQARGAAFAQARGLRFLLSEDELIEASDALVVTSENVFHADHIERCAAKGKPVLCEKPLAPTREQGERILTAVRESGITLMTAFPCPFAPAFESALDKVAAGKVGKIVAINATNHGRCPFGWFVQPELSGGGAMVDHVVHVADLIRRLLGEEPSRVYARTGTNVYGQAWDDSAVLHVDFASGAFATIDSSWSRPESYKTWGDVTLKIVGTDGLIEVDLFGVGMDHYVSDKPNHRLAGWGTNMDLRMVGEFVRAVTAGDTPRVTAEDGWRASLFAIAGYESVASGRPVNL